MANRFFLAPAISQQRTVNTQVGLGKSASQYSAEASFIKMSLGKVLG